MVGVAGGHGERRDLDSGGSSTFQQQGKPGWQSDMGRGGTDTTGKNPGELQRGVNTFRNKTCRLVSTLPAGR